MHLCHPLQCQHSIWLLHNQMGNLLEQRLFIQTEYLIRILDVSILINQFSFCTVMWLIFPSDALQLSIPAQGLANGDAALPHAAYPGIQPYPGVGEWFAILFLLFLLLIPCCVFCVSFVHTSVFNVFRLAYLSIYALYIFLIQYLLSIEGQFYQNLIRRPAAHFIVLSIRYLYLKMQKSGILQKKRIHDILSKIIFFSNAKYCFWIKILLRMSWVCTNHGYCHFF